MGWIGACGQPMADYHIAAESGGSANPTYGHSCVANRGGPGGMPFVAEGSFPAVEMPLLEQTIEVAFRHARDLRDETPVPFISFKQEIQVGVAQLVQVRRFPEAEIDLA